MVDSGSSDKTTEIVKKLIEKYDPSDTPFRLVEEDERKGKASAINFGKRHAKGAIILVTDANSIYDKNALKEMMPHFKDSKVVLSVEDILSLIQTKPSLVLRLFTGI